MFPCRRQPTTSKARRWALENLHRPVTLRELAAQEATSAGTFTRRFRDEIGTSPGRWLTRQRIERACALLERTVGVSPSAYRATFRGREPRLPALVTTSLGAAVSRTSRS
ncbi:helix-turn-helix domain-containing protein [Pseudonocardia kunmingensis]|uniref:helix-turn-helix domain-containing protein n=1 Tax=Pseudonocardia kunmingensis TaxID=630975 RepID=UPI001B87FF66